MKASKFTDGRLGVRVILSSHAEANIGGRERRQVREKSAAKRSRNGVR